MRLDLVFEAFVFDISEMRLPIAVPLAMAPCPPTINPPAATGTDTGVAPTALRKVLRPDTVIIEPPTPISRRP